MNNKEYEGFKAVLDDWSFTEEKYEYMDDLYMWFSSLSVSGCGELQFNFWEKKLYLWSGSGMACYVTHQDATRDEPEGNSDYAYAITINTPERLREALICITQGSVND